VARLEPADAEVAVAILIYWADVALVDPRHRQIIGRMDAAARSLADDRVVDLRRRLPRCVDIGQAARMLFRNALT
jgi:hypothetical protein